MDQLDENSLNKPISDIVKEFKANGNFDQFRKDCFAEITAQSSFQTLSKSVDDMVQKFLREQNQSLRKNEMRDLLRRKLNEYAILKFSYFGENDFFTFKSKFPRLEINLIYKILFEYFCKKVTYKLVEKSILYILMSNITTFG